MGGQTERRVPFNRPREAGPELDYLAEVVRSGRLAGDGPFTARCHAWLRDRTGAASAWLTHSCTAALEMAALLLDLGPGDEVLTPSFAFVSTANAIVLRGATPVFVDIRADTLNIDEGLLEAAITARTKAIFLVHYAGVSCEMDAVLATARAHGIAVVEDAAQGHLASYRGRLLGSMGALGALSFHETKNLVSGEGGALLVNDPGMSERAAILREKGTNRAAFLDGQVDKYTWVDVGSSYLPSELVAAHLWAQLERAEEITAERLRIWRLYHERLAPMEEEGLLRRPIVPSECESNGHIYYILTRTHAERETLRFALKARGVEAPFHYVPLHSAPAGRRFGRVSGALNVTDDLAGRILRLPMWRGLSDDDVARVCDAVAESLGSPGAFR